ncbi:hypothetical protein D018_3146B, partial [Vibrio parahaemolyticus VP2007-007]
IPQFIFSGSMANRSLTDIQLNSTIPIGLPKTKPKKTAKVIGEVAFVLFSEIPALEKANSGKIINPTQG